MKTVLQWVGAAGCILIALRCLFVRVATDPAPRSPDVVDKVAYELIFRRPPPPTRSTSSNTTLARVVGFLLFGGLAAWLIVSALN